MLITDTFEKSLTKNVLFRLVKSPNMKYHQNLKFEKLTEKQCFHIGESKKYMTQEVVNSN